MNTTPQLLDVVALLTDVPRTVSCAARSGPSWSFWMALDPSSPPAARSVIVDEHTSIQTTLKIYTRVAMRRIVR
jgi:hypothetical protein